ncbi:MAG TPA: CsbD family protein [Anaerolineales bacterium]
MDKDKMKGKVTDISGRIKRQAGEWTGDKELQAEGAAEQVKGKAQKGVGAAKELVRDMKQEAERRAAHHKVGETKEIRRQEIKREKKDVA